MPVPAAFMIMSLFPPVTAPVAAPHQGAPDTSAFHCPRTSAYVADAAGAYRGQPLTPKKLTELPPATAYMAVYRQVGGCESPLTMAAYRNPRRR